jgi:ectoine hydroxylase-related dioxygenase (phytanoyl-CoA dioxygenase family)
VTDDAYECEAGGPTMVVPGSHKMRRHPTRAEADAADGAQPIIARKGSVGVWRGETWHGSYPRTIEGERVTAHISYARLACRPIEDYSAYANDAWLEGKPAALRTLFGLDDFLGKPAAMRAKLLRPTFEASRL